MRDVPHFLDAFLISDFFHEIGKLIIKLDDKVSYFQKFSPNVMWCFIII